MPPRKAAAPAKAAASTPASSKEPILDEEILYCFYNKLCDSSTCDLPVCPEFWQRFPIPKRFDKGMMVKDWVENSNLKGKTETFTFCGAFPVAQAEIECPLVMQPRFHLVAALTMGHVIENFRGICIVSLAESENYKASMVACQTLLDTVILQDPRELRLSAYLRIAHRKYQTTPGAQIYNYSKMDLDHNNIREVKTGLPEFVKEKIALLESRRDWSKLPAAESSIYLSKFKGLDTTELIITESSTADAIPSPTTWTIHSYASDDEGAPLETIRILNSHSRPKENTQNLEHSIKKSFFQPVFDWMRLVYEEQEEVFLSDAAKVRWPHQMGILLVTNSTKAPKTQKNRSNNILVDTLSTPKKSDVRIGHPVSDASFFFRSEPLCLGEVDSHSNKSSNVGDKCDRNRALSHAAFLVRFINLTLDVETFCLPVFWVSDTGKVEIALVFQAQNNDFIHYHVLKWEGSFFEWKGTRGQAHFMLRLMNTVDPRTRFFSSDQHLLICEAWRALSAAGLGRYEDDPSLPKRRKTGEKTYSQVDSVNYITQASPGVYLVKFGSGRSCVRKNLIRTSDEQELAIYERLREYSGIANFIFDWSSGYWSTGRYLQLPHLIPVGDELRKHQGGCLKGQTPLLCTQLLSGIHFLHSQLHIAHMDIKPDNLVLDEGLSGQTVKIIDFNTAIVDAELKVLPGARGTIGYMAPEVLGSLSYNPFLADRYSCGVCMTELLTVDRDEACLTDIVEKFIVFATKLCNPSPNRRPSLIRCPKLFPRHSLASTLRN